ncbi:hypothetical protein O8B93_27485 [Agrobacterium rhizogenes]|nr:hypothetical protein [Rhizobium rhizogenes]
MGEATSFWPDNLADYASSAGLPISLIALWFVLRQLKKDGLASSANAVGAAYNSIIKAINDLDGKEEKDREAALSEVFNQLEMACALKRDGQFSGHSGGLASKMLIGVIEMLLSDEENRSYFYRATSNSDTFQNIRAIMTEGNANTPPVQPKQFMKGRAEVAEIVYKDYKEMQRATFELAGQYGRWLLASLLLIHGGALFGLFTFLSELADKPDALARYQWTVWWFVSGLMLTLFAGLFTWLNWSMNSNNYEAWANKAMLWDSDEWVGQNVHTWGINFSYWAALVLGVLSSLCIVGGAYSTLNGNWVQLVATALA